jgi:transcriptional regulator with XRE-family HTH domain
MPTTYLITGPELRARREALGLSREQLARCSHEQVSSASIESYEMGYTPRRSRVLPLIVAALEAAERAAEESP